MHEKASFYHRVSGMRTASHKEVSRWQTSGFSATEMWSFRISNRVAVKRIVEDRTSLCRLKSESLQEIGVNKPDVGLKRYFARSREHAPGRARDRIHNAVGAEVYMQVNADLAIRIVLLRRHGEGIAYHFDRPGIGC